MSYSHPTDQDYHGGALVGVPFDWESQPGTPKIRFLERNNTLPPLTPPPSYFYKTCTSRKPNKMLSIGRASSSSSLSTSGSWRMAYSRRIWSLRGSSKGSRISRELEFEEDAEVESSVSTSCFRFGPEVNAMSRGRYPSSMIKVVLRDV